MLFKRPYDPDQSKREDALIRQEGERLLALQKKEAAARRAKEVSATPSGELIDLDAVEFEAATAENRSKQESRLKSAVESVATYTVISAEPISAAYSPTSTKATMQVVIDGTEKLLKDGNKYRAKEAENLAKEAAMSYYRSSGLKLKESYDEPTMFLSLKDVTIGVQVVINFEGKQKIVARETVGGYW